MRKPGNGLYVAEFEEPAWLREEYPEGVELSEGDSALIEAISDHVTEHYGDQWTVLHEKVSPLVHIDVFAIRQADRYTLVTCGMSERAMNAPPEFAPAYAELVLALPRMWPMTTDAWREDANYWPIRMLKSLARYPHEFDTWLWYGHSVPAPEPHGNFTASVLDQPLLTPESFDTLTTGEREIAFLGVFPVYAQELDLKIERGTQALMELFAEHGVTELLDLDRPSVV